MFFRTADGEGGEKDKTQENDSRGCLVRDFSLEKYDGNSLYTYTYMLQPCHGAVY